jgi:hypothetical protein
MRYIVKHKDGTELYSDAFDEVLRYLRLRAPVGAICVRVADGVVLAVKPGLTSGALANLERIAGVTLAADDDETPVPVEVAS